MTYEEVVKHAERLSYREKFRLAQLLLQLGRKEEEQQNPAARLPSAGSKRPDAELVTYVAARLLKLRPRKKDTLLNSIGAMFQFQGAVSYADKEAILSELVRLQHIELSETGRVSYPTA